MGATARYWRMVCQNPGQQYCSVSDLQFQDITGVMPAYTAIGEGTYYNGNDYASGIGNPSASFWAGDQNGGPVAIGVDFGVGVEIHTVVFSSRQDGFPEQAPRHVQWQYSDDGAAWTQQGSADPTGWAQGEERTFDIFDPAPALANGFGAAIASRGDAVAEYAMFAAIMAVSVTPPHADAELNSFAIVVASYDVKYVPPIRATPLPCMKWALPLIYNREL